MTFFTCPLVAYDLSGFKVGAFLIEHCYQNDMGGIWELYFSDIHNAPYATLNLSPNTCNPVPEPQILKPKRIAANPKSGTTPAQKARP